MSSSPRPRRTLVVGFAAFVMTAGLLVNIAFAANQPGELRAWGLNIYGQLGDGTTAAHGPGAVSDVADAVDLHGGRGHVVALRATGTVLGWGQNNYGQVGDGTATARSLPTPVPGLSNVIEVATGHYHSMALVADGTVRTWGYNASGQLGDGSTTARRVPVTVSGLTGVSHIAGGRDMSYAVRSDGTVWAWGRGADGELGNGATATRTTPVAVGSLTGVTAIAGGRNHGLAVASDGTVWAWGDNAFGQIGDGTTTDRLSPVQVSGLTNITLVGAGAHHSYALRSDGTVFSWGRNNLGQLGDGSLTMRRTPVIVNGIGSSATFVGSGRDHGLAVMADGTVRAWGRNDFRQLGDGTTTNRTSAIVVPGVTGAQEAHGGQDYSVALVASGPPDTTDPTQPGTPTGVSNSPSTIGLTWAASDDDISTSLRYDVYRDGSLAGLGHERVDDLGVVHRRGPGRGFDAHVSRDRGRRRIEREPAERGVGADRGADGAVLDLLRRLLQRWVLQLDLGDQADDRHRQREPVRSERARRAGEPDGIRHEVARRELREPVSGHGCQHREPGRQHRRARSSADGDRRPGRPPDRERLRRARHEVRRFDGDTNLHPGVGNRLAPAGDVRHRGCRPAPGICTGTASGS